jgi:flagellar hook-associated protein 1
MGLSMALSNALSGMRVGQNGLDVLSRNVANAGKPGYHRQSLSVIDTLGANSSYVRNGALTRAFDQSLQQHYTRAVSDSGFTAVRSGYLDRLQGAFGMPGSAGSLDAAFSSFRTSLDALATSPDSYSTRAGAVARAQEIALTLNKLSAQVQTLRLEAEGRIAANVSGLNQALTSLERLNLSLADSSIDLNSRASLLDQRDRLVADVAQVLDVRVDYRSDGTVALMTRSGVGLLDVRASVLEFNGVGTLSATSRFSSDPGSSGVGSLLLHTSAGMTIDLVQQNALRSGELAALIDLRDKTLVEAQDQLDEIAAGLALSMSTVDTPGTAIANGYALDLGAITARGNGFTIDYTTADGAVRSLRLVNSATPADYVGADGKRVVGVDFTSMSAVMSAVSAALGPGFPVSNTGTTIQIAGNGSTTAVNGLVARTTVAGNRDADLGLSLFVDNGNTDYTGYLEGIGQKRGFAARIGVSAAVLDDNALMVQFKTGGSLGASDRADYLAARLGNMQFAASSRSSSGGASFRLSGTVSDLINQTINYQGSIAAAAAGEDQTQALTLETVNQRLDAEYGVDIDEEMARLMELQNAFAANARVVSVVQELLDALMRI